MILEVFSNLNDSVILCRSLNVYYQKCHCYLCGFLQSHHSRCTSLGLLDVPSSCADLLSLLSSAGPQPCVVSLIWRERGGDAGDRLSFPPVLLGVAVSLPVCLEDVWN